MADGDLKKTGVQLVAEGSAEFLRTMARSRGAVTDFGDQGKTTSRSWVQALGDIRASTVIAMAAVTAGLAAVGKLYRATVGETMDYAEAVGRTSRALGIHADAASRVLQVLDDFGVSESEATAAMRIALSQGIVPNVSGLADLSDRYLAATSATDRAAIAQQALGRNWQTFTRVLEAGGEAIRSMGANVQDGLVLTDRDIIATERLRVAQDALNDTAKSLAMSIGMALIPGLASYLSGFNDVITAHEAGHSVWIELIRAIRDERDATDQAADSAEAAVAAEVLLQESHYTSARTWPLAEQAADRYTLAVGSAAAATTGATDAMRLFSDEQLLAAVAADSNSRMLGIEREAIEALRDRNVVITVTTIRREIQYMLRAGQAGERGMAGYQHGGSFTVGGRGGTDRNIVSFAATRGERVIVQPPAAYPAGPSYSDSHDQRTNNVSIQGQDLSNPFVVRRLFDQWLQGG